MAGDLILLTGGESHIGFATLREALSKCYKVRAVVPQKSSIAEIKAANSIQPYLDNLSFVIVPDMTVDGAFDEALKDVEYILHIASPVAHPCKDYESEFFKPAVNGTLSILNSALKVPSIKRVVITSSQSAVVPESSGEDTIYTADNTLPDPHGPYPDYISAYAASKVKTYNAVLDFIKTKNPPFEVTLILPSLVIGKNELASTTKAAVADQNTQIMGVLLGKHSPKASPGATVHIDDVAFVHVKALDPSVAGNERFACSCNGIEGIVWNEANDIVKKHFPKAVKQGMLPANGSCPTKKIKYDARRTEEVLGFEFKGLEEQVISQAGWYIAVAKMERGY